MDLEQLKAILETIGGATAAAKQFGIFWLGVVLLKSLFHYALIGGLLVILYKVGYRIIVSCQEISFARSLRQIVQPENAYGDMRSSEKAAIVEAVKRGIQKATDR